MVTSACSARSPNFPPMPRIERIGSVSSICAVARRPTTVCLSGLFRAEASFASILLCATPPLIVNPASARTFARARAQIIAPTARRRSEALERGSNAPTSPEALTPRATASASAAEDSKSVASSSDVVFVHSRDSRAMIASTSAVTSRYASSMLARSTTAPGEDAVRAAMTRLDASR